MKNLIKDAVKITDDLRDWPCGKATANEAADLIEKLCIELKRRKLDQQIESKQISV